MWHFSATYRAYDRRNSFGVVSVLFPSQHLRGKINSCHLQNVLESVASPFVQTIEKGIFQQDNALSHIAKQMQIYFHSPLIHWSPRPLSIWNNIGQRLSHATNRKELWLQVNAVWQKISQDTLSP